MAGINELVRRLERLGSTQVKTAIAERISKTMVDETLQCFKQQRDPYGTRWAPRIKSAGGWPLLEKTGAGMDSIAARASSQAARVSIISRMKFHQTGTSKMVARSFFPDPARGLGLWAEPVNRAARDAVSDLMKGQDG